VLITESEIKSTPETYKAVTINLERPYPKAKTISRITENLARAEAERNQVNECLFINSEGYLTEGSITNLFLVKRGKILMPRLHNHLQGTMQQQVLSLADKYHIKVIEKDLKLKRLLKADEAFLTNSLIGIKPLVEVNSKPIKTGKITQLLAKNLWT
jgi:branched-subunit amino acid aminotransferase/4-amino-4-deoxychorismate lyase